MLVVRLGRGLQMDGGEVQVWGKEGQGCKLQAAWRNGIGQGAMQGFSPLGPARSLPLRRHLPPPTPLLPH